MRDGRNIVVRDVRIVRDVRRSTDRHRFSTQTSGFLRESSLSRIGPEDGLRLKRVQRSQVNLPDAAPPVTRIFLRLPPARNPIHCPSGENNGLSAPVVSDGFHKFRHYVACRQYGAASRSSRRNVRRQLLDELGLPDTNGSEDEQQCGLCRSLGGERPHDNDRVRVMTDRNHRIYRLGRWRGRRGTSDSPLSGPSRPILIRSISSSCSIRIRA
jgi:hypothetical protein